MCGAARTSSQRRSQATARLWRPRKITDIPSARPRRSKESPQKTAGPPLGLKRPKAVQASVKLVEAKAWDLQPPPGKLPVQPLISTRLRASGPRAATFARVPACFRFLAGRFAGKGFVRHIARR